jgi:predicted alpha/beta-hydrolase family hydrolase
MAGGQDSVIVGQSYGAFIATMVPARLLVRQLVLLADHPQGAPELDDGDHLAGV